MPNLEEVFRLSGVPTHTFVEPVRYSAIKVAVRTPGRCVVLEGPSGIGKTSAITRVIEELGHVPKVLQLSARRKDDLELIAALPEMGDIGTVIVDDFHRLPDEIKGRHSRLPAPPLHPDQRAAVAAAEDDGDVGGGRGCRSFRRHDRVTETDFTDKDIREGAMKRRYLGVLALFVALIPTAAFADWVVVQPADNGQPYLARFTGIEEARRNLLAACHEKHDNCRTVITGNSGCVAIATTGVKYGVAKGGSQSRADAAALNKCESLDAGACRVIVQFCGR